MIYNIIAGGAGFIGTNLTKKLLEDDNNSVIILDNLSSGKKKNTEQFLSKRCYALICDIKEEFVFSFKLNDILFKQMHCDKTKGDEIVIYNLACPASPVFYQKDPIDTTMTCVLGSKNILDYSTYVGAKVLFTSTSEVYGDPTEHPQKEEYRGNVNCDGIRSCYDEGKRCAESLYFDFNRRLGTDVKVARLFNTYGPYMRPDDGRFISNFITQALDGKPITIYGDGKQTRSICYVDDTVDGLIKLMNSNIHGPINIGNPQEKTINEWACDIANIIFPNDEEFAVEYKPLPGDDPTRRKPDISKAKELLGWEPKTDNKQGLINTINYFKQTYGKQ